jgi:uncharacterized protein
MSVRLKDLLGRFRVIDGVDLAAVVAQDGLLIEGNAVNGIELDAVCAVASHGLALADALGREVAKGGALLTVLEYEQGLVLLEPINSEAMLLIMVNGREQLGQLRLLTSKHRAAFEEALNAI